jgi:pseudouridine kinase
VSVVVLGGANVDLKARSKGAVVAATSNPGTACLTPGGVGRNVAENLARLGTPVRLLTAIGNDVLGGDLLAATARAGVDVTLIRRLEMPTGTYTAILDERGELVVAVADMLAVESLTPADVAAASDEIAAADLVVLDGNLLPATTTAVLDVAEAAGVRVVVEPVSVPKSRRLAGVVRRPLFLLTPNAAELVALTGLADRDAALASLHACGVETVWLRLGAEGSILSTADGVVELAPAAGGEVVDVTGGGDGLLAAFLSLFYI